MAHPAYLREKARTLRVERRLSIDEIAHRLALPKTTVFYWVRDLPLGRSRRENGHPGNRAMQRKYRLLREEAYRDGERTFAALATDSTFRDFICMYIGEGFKRSRNTVSLGNSDPLVVALAARWMGAFSRRKLTYWLQYHSDQDLEELRAFWAATLGISPEAVRFQRKSNSNQLLGRTWRSRHGVLTVATSDTLLRARLQAWMDCLQSTWIHSPATGA
jgi:hypothetical protein